MQPVQQATSSHQKTPVQPTGTQQQDYADPHHLEESLVHQLKVHEGDARVGPSQHEQAVIPGALMCGVYNNLAVQEHGVRCVVREGSVGVKGRLPNARNLAKVDRARHNT
jgi:hypothetical protein